MAEEAERKFVVKLKDITVTYIVKHSQTVLSYLALRFDFSRFLLWYEMVHAAVRTLPIVTS